jgi:stromal membrane-associated protein
MLLSARLHRKTAAGQAVGAAGPSQVRRAQQPDLFGDDAGSPPPRASTAAPVASRPPPKAEPAPPKQTKPADSLLGLDFFGTEAPPPNRPSSAAATSGAQSRPDLKQSILSLYASAPKPQPQQRQSSHVSSGSFGGMQSPMQQSPPPQQTQFGGMNDAFSNLSFSGQKSPTMQAQPKQSAFSGLGNIPPNGRPHKLHHQRLAEGVSLTQSPFNNHLPTAFARLQLL